MRIVFFFFPIEKQCLHSWNELCVYKTLSCYLKVSIKIRNAYDVLEFNVF